jgi:hypothetical protein
VLVPGKPLQPSITFAGKAGTYPSEAPFNKLRPQKVFKLPPPLIAVPHCWRIFLMAAPFRGFERLNRFNYRRNEERWRRDSRPNSTRYKNGRQGQPNKAVAFCSFVKSCPLV